MRDETSTEMMISVHSKVAEPGDKKYLSNEIHSFEVSKPKTCKLGGVPLTVVKESDDSPEPMSSPGSAESVRAKAIRSYHERNAGAETTIFVPAGATRRSRTVS